MLYTDGVTEAENPKQEPYSEQRLHASFAGLEAIDPAGIVNGLREDIARHTEGQPQSDDITLLALKFKGQSTAAKSSH